MGYFGRLLFCFGASAAAAVSAARPAGAAPPWVDRALTLPGGDFAFDVGAGVGHVQVDPIGSDTAAGVNAEFAAGVTDRVELGVRSGLRFGTPFDRSIRADEYGRLFDRQTVYPGGDVLANPELRVRGAPVRGRVFELAIEGRLVLPFATGSDAGVLFGLPLAFHLGNRVRLDTGVYVPLVFTHPTNAVDLSLPLDVWIQASPRVWLGPMTGIFVQQPGGAAAQTWASLGFGFGYQITHYLDFKAMVLFPAVTQDSHSFGAGAGIQIRIE